MKTLFFIVAMAIATLVSGAKSTIHVGSADNAIISLTDKVPAKVMKEFEASFIFSSEGDLRGARIDMLRPYLRIPQILTLIDSYISNEKSVLYEGYKPKGPRGCKANRNWLCVVRDIDIIR